MPARRITLDPADDRFIDDQVEIGAYPDAEHVIQAALGRLRTEDDAARTTRFHALVQEGLADIAEGRFETVDDIESWMAGLGQPDR